MRIVSLVPSSTHTIAACPNLFSSLVACTKFCVEPAGLYRNIEMVGGTKDPDIEKIRSLNPSHILMNSEENKLEHFELLENIAKVHVSLPKSPFDVVEMFLEMGHFLDEPVFFENLTVQLKSLLTQVSQKRSWECQGLRDGLSYLYLIWREPYMAIGQDTYISRLLELFSWNNAYSGPERYPSLTVQDMAHLQADVILLATEPYPFRERDWIRLEQEWKEAIAGCKPPDFWKIDGRLCSWHGKKTLEVLEEFRKFREFGQLGHFLRPLSLKA